MAVRRLHRSVTAWIIVAALAGYAPAAIATSRAHVAVAAVSSGASADDFVRPRARHGTMTSFMTSG
jgi:hypothetical protein